MDEEIKNRLNSQDEILGKIFVSVEKTRKYFKWTMIVTIVVIVLPLIIMAFAIPKFISTYSTLYSGLL